MATPTSTYPPPLSSLRVIELAGLAPAPYCGLLLAQYGASVLRIDKPATNEAQAQAQVQSNSAPSSAPPGPAPDLLTAHKSSLPLNLKSPASRSLLIKLISTSDVLIDPFRPGVLERLGLDPTTVLLPLNPRLIVVRLTGFRKDGKYKDMAGHDINYLAVSGVLSLLGAPGHTSTSPTPPIPPANILADFAGGGLTAFAGVLLALISRGVTGRGQIVDATMVDGASSLATFPRLLQRTPTWNRPRGHNLLDGGAPYYACYACADADADGFVAVGALEERFFHQLLAGLGLRVEDVVPVPGMNRADRAAWPFMRAVFERVFRSRTRREWEDVFQGTDACVTPVLSFAELRRGGYQFRPLVGLTGSPASAEGDGSGDMDDGDGDGYVSRGLKIGTGGDGVLRDWLGWTRGIEWDLDGAGAAVMTDSAKSKL